MDHVMCDKWQLISRIQRNAKKKLVRQVFGKPTLKGDLRLGL